MSPSLIDTFFEKFELFADAPGAVPKLRELVLELAVKGNFVDDCASDAVKQGGDWPRRHLGDIAEFINGDRSKNYPSKRFRVETGVPFINAGHLSNGDVDASNLDYITPAHFDQLGSGKIEVGDVLYCIRGSLGKCAVVQSIRRGAIASSLLIIRPNSEILVRFLYFWLLSPAGLRMIAKYDNGSAQPNLSAANVKKFELLLPPLAEQKRIVAKVDELMALCDRLEAQLKVRDEKHAAVARASLARFSAEPTAANLNLLFHRSYTISPDELRKTILTMAVQGKLVPQDPKDKIETLSEKAILAQYPFEIPGAWIWRKLGDLTEINGGFAFKSADYTDKGIRVLRISDFDEFGFKDHNVVRHPFSPELGRFALETDNILMAMTGGTVGKSCLVRALPEPMLVNQRVATIKVSKEAEPKFIDIVIRSEMTQEVIRTAKNSTNDNISMADIRGFLMPLPPLAEQRRIVAKVDQLMALVDQLEQQLTASRATAEKLLEAVVAELTAC